MKKIIFILALFVSLVANAQYTPPAGYTNINARYDWLAGVFRALGIPAGGSAAFTTGQAHRAGAIYYDSTGVDSGLYVWSGLAWRSYEPYTDADARAAISLTTTGTSGAATYSSATGVFNIPDYGSANFYNADGTLSGARNVNSNSNNLTFSNTATFGVYDGAFVTNRFLVNTAQSSLTSPNGVKTISVTNSGVAASLISTATANVVYYDDGTGLLTYGAANTPTLQQVLDAGSTLTSSETISAGTNALSITSSNVSAAFNVTNSGVGFGINAVGFSNSAIYADQGSGIEAGQFRTSNATTNTILDVLNIDRRTSGAAASGIGGSIAFTNELTSGSSTKTHRVASKLSLLGDADYTGEYDLLAYDNAIEETFMNIQKDLVRINNNADTLATKAYARSVGGGGGDVTKVGTPSNHQLAIWTGDGTIKGNTLTGNRALVTDADGEPIAATTTDTEIGFVSGLTSNAQTQIDGKATGSITQNWFDDDLTLNGVTTKINRADFFDDMLTTPNSTAGTSYMFEFASGTGADASIGNTGTSPPDGSGWASMVTGTTTTGISALGATSVSVPKSIIDTTKIYRFETRLQIVTLSDDTNDFSLIAGLVNRTTGTTGNEQIWFRYNDNTNAGNWTCYSGDATTTESTDSGVAASAGTPVILGFEYDNAAVRFYINGVLVATHITRVPSHGSLSYYSDIAMVKTLGTTSREVFIDYVKYRRL